MTSPIGRLFSTSASISVIMSVHNAQETIALAVRSTLFALRQGDELLVGLHNCTDKTKERLAAITDSRLRTFEFKDVPFSEVLNALALLAKGNLLGRMDGDDVCLPWRFIAQRRAIHSRNVDFTFSTAFIFYDQGKLPFFGLQAPLSLNHQEISIAMQQKAVVMNPTMLCKRSAFLDVGGYHDQVAEDWQFNLRAMASGKNFERIGLPTIAYRISPSQLSRVQREEVDSWRLSKEFEAHKSAAFDAMSYGGVPSKARQWRIRVEILGVFSALFSQKKL